MRDLEAFGGLVSVAVNNALAPLREKQAALEAQVITLNATVADLRSQVSATKAVDTSVYERLAVSESLVKSLPAVFDRVHALESRPAVTPDADLREQVKSLLQLPERVAVVESRMSTPAPADPAVADLRERLHAVETKAAHAPELPEIPREIGDTLDALTERVLRLEIKPVETDASLHERVRTLEMAPGPVAPDLSPVYERLACAETTITSMTKLAVTIGEVRDRFVAMEARAAVTVAPETDVRDHLVALSPVMVQLAGLESEVKSVKEGLRSADGFRDRLVAVETTVKGIVERPAPVPDTSVHDRQIDGLSAELSTLSTQIATVSQAQKSFEPIVQRVVVLETKSDQPIVDPHADLPARVHALEAVPPRVAAIEAVLPRIGEQDKAVTELRERVVGVEARPVQTVASVAPDTELRDRLQKVQIDVSHLGSQAAILENRMAASEQRQADVVADVRKDISVVSERVAVAEVRAFTPGPAGAAGRDGIDGKPGVDGVSYDELSATLENDRTFVMRATKGDRVKEIASVKIPFMVHRGTWAEREYDRGDVVTWGGSMWLADGPTNSKPGEGSTNWRLVVKRGRDGADGKPVGDNGQPGLPVVRTR